MYKNQLIWKVRKVEMKQEMRGCSFSYTFTYMKSLLLVFLFLILSLFHLHSFHLPTGLLFFFSFFPLFSSFPSYLLFAYVHISLLTGLFSLTSLKQLNTAFILLFLSSPALFLSSSSLDPCLQHGLTFHEWSFSSLLLSNLFFSSLFIPFLSSVSSFPSLLFFLYLPFLLLLIYLFSFLFPLLLLITLFFSLFYFSFLFFSFLFPLLFLITLFFPLFYFSFLYFSLFFPSLFFSLLLYSSLVSRHPFSPSLFFLSIPLVSFLFSFFSTLL